MAFWRSELLKVLARVKAIEAFAADPTLITIAGLTGAANKGIYFTGADAAALFDLTAAGRALLDDASAAAQRATLGTVWEPITGWVPVTGSPTYLEMINLPVAGFSRYKLIFGVRPSTNNVSCRMQVQTGGSTWQASGYGYGADIVGIGGSGTGGYGSTPDAISSSIGLSEVGSAAPNGVGSGAGEFITGEIDFTPADANQRRLFVFDTAWFRSGGTGVRAMGMGYYGSTTSITGVRVYFNAGTVAYGYYAGFGIRD